MFKVIAAFIYIVIWLFSAPFFTANYALKYAEQTSCVECIDREAFATRGLMAGMLWPLFVKDLFIR